MLQFLILTEIKKMKEIQKDILEITPKIQNSEDDNESSESILEKSFEEIFRDFYKKLCKSRIKVT